jgi:hypothetical protein
MGPLLVRIRIYPQGCRISEFVVPDHSTTHSLKRLCWDFQSKGDLSTSSTSPICFRFSQVSSAKLAVDVWVIPRGTRI